MKFSVKYAMIALVAALFCVDAHADGGVNTGYSPYSKFGLGRLSARGTAFNQSMGGVGVATRNNHFINILNPAAVTARDTLAFMADFGIVQDNAYYAQGDLKSVDNTFNINNFVMSFPIWKSSAFMVGINPYSGYGYDFTSPVTDPSIIGHTGNITDVYSGSGSLYEMFLGAGVTFWKRLSLGAQFNFYFGNLQKTAGRNFSETTNSSMYDVTDMVMRGFSGKFGLQYEQPIGKDRLTIGATYKLRTKFIGTAEEMRYKTQGNFVDTLAVPQKIDLSKINIPDEISVGLSYKHLDVWSAEFDYTRSDWTKSGLDVSDGFSSKGFTTTVSQSFNAGFEITPSRNDIRYYMKRVTYRAGVYYNQDYFKYSGNAVSSAALTLGMTFPVYIRGGWSNGITFGMELGQRGNIRNNMVRERFVNFKLGFNIYDIWFIKPKYD